MVGTVDVPVLRIWHNKRRCTFMRNIHGEYKCAIHRVQQGFTYHEKDIIADPDIILYKVMEYLESKYGRTDISVDYVR